MIHVITVLNSDVSTTKTRRQIARDAIPVPGPNPVPVLSHAHLKTLALIICLPVLLLYYPGAINGPNSSVLYISETSDYTLN